MIRRNTVKNAVYNTELFRGIYLFALTGILAACVSSGTVPVTEGGSARETTLPPSAPQSGESTKPAETLIKPPTNSAAQILLARADTAIAEQQTDTAIVLLERAIRIEPREALLWIKLSRAHLIQGDDVTAFQHARKAIALAGSDGNKSAAAWLQLADVYQAQGKSADAQQIQRRYGRARG